MPGSEGSLSDGGSLVDGQNDEEVRGAFQPFEHIVKDLTVARALAFVARASQEHQLKIEGVEDYMAEDETVFVDGTSVMAMGTEDMKEREYTSSRESNVSQQSLTWFIKGGETYLWCTRNWHSVTIGGAGFDLVPSRRPQRSTASVAKVRTYKVGDKVLVPVPGKEDFVLCQVSAICVVLPKKETAVEDALTNDSQREDGPPAEFLEHFHGHEGQVTGVMVFLYLSHKNLIHEDMAVNFKGLHGVDEGMQDEEMKFPRPIAVVRLILNSDLIFCNLSHICCAPLFRCPVLRRSTMVRGPQGRTTVCLTRLF
jgi:hypothetical protein